MAKLLLDEDDVAFVLSLSRRELRSLVRRGALPHVDLPGGKIRFTDGDLRDFAAQLPRRGPESEGGPTR